MSEADRVLRPIHEAEPAIRSLDTYESPAALQDALRATSHAVEQTLRLLLRSDVSAPDALRMSALSPQQMPPDELLAVLRRRDLIDIPVAGRIHELRHVLERAGGSAPRASDADTARMVVADVTSQVRQRFAPSEPESEREADAEAGGRPGHEAVRAAPAVGEQTPAPRRPLYLAGGVALLLALGLALVWIFGRTSHMEQGITAFAQGRAGVAEQHFRAALHEDRANVTARLYLGRILRVQGRRQESAELLRAAAAAAPRDPAVRRELGYLFLDLDRPAPAAEQFRVAVELQPEEPLNWVWLVQSLRLAGDASAGEWLRRAPAEARTLMETRGR